MRGTVATKTIAGLFACAWLFLSLTARADESPSKAKGEHATSGSPEASKKDLVFRKPGGTNTMYFVFKPDGTYQFISREHLFTAVLGRGTWKQNEKGQLLLTSTAERDKGQVVRINPIKYRGWVFLTSPDHTFIKIYAPTPEKGKAAVDEMGPQAHAPRGLFTATDVEKFRCEVKTPQPFLFYPEMNQPRKQPLLDATGN